MDDLKQLRERMERAVVVLVTDLASFRTGRASSSLIENIVVPAYGGTQRLRVLELGNIQAADAHMLTIAPWDPSVIGEIRKAILEANVGLNPQNYLAKTQSSSGPHPPERALKTTPRRQPPGPRHPRPCRRQ